MVPRRYLHSNKRSVPRTDWANQSQYGGFVLEMVSESYSEGGLQMNNKLLLLIKVGVVIWADWIIVSALYDPTQNKVIALVSLLGISVITVCHELLDYLEGN